jgi:ribosomal protein L7/L12
MYVVFEITQRIDVPMEVVQEALELFGKGCSRIDVVRVIRERCGVSLHVANQIMKQIEAFVKEEKNPRSESSIGDILKEALRSTGVKVNE